MNLIRRSVSFLLALVMLLSLLPTLPLGTKAAALQETQEESFSQEISTRAASVGSISVPAYSGGTSSGWMTYDCGANLGMGDTGTESKMQIITGTTASQFLAYGTSLKNLGYTTLYEKKIPAQTEYNRHYKFLAPDGSHTIYTYFVQAYSEVRIIVDTNKDSFRRFSYTSAGSGSGNGRTEVYMIPVSASADGFLYSSAYGSQKRNDAGALMVIKMADNSLFVVDGGSYIQVSDRDCERIYNFLRQITGIPEGQKMYINTWFVTHYHDDHVSGFSRLMYKYNTQFELRNVMYNFDVVGSSRDNMQIIGQLFPNAKYYKQHTGEYFTICDVRFDVLYTVEDLYTPNGTSLVLNDANCLRKTKDENNVSSVLRVSFDNKTMLITGDLYDGDAILMAMYPAADLHADILQIPHHGFDSHVTLVKTIAPTISFIHQTETAMFNRKANYNNNHKWMPYAGTIYYGNSETVGYCAAEGIFYHEPFTESVDWLGWGNKTWDVEEANYYESAAVQDPEKYYRYDRVTSAGSSIGGTFAIVDDKMSYPLSYSTVDGAVGNARPSFCSNDTYYFSASQRRNVNWQITASTVVPTYAIVSGGKGYYANATVRKGSGDYWGSNTKNANMALGRGDTYAASGMFSAWASFTNQMETTTNSLRLDMMQDNTFLLYARYNSNGSTYHPLYRDPSLTEDKGWGASNLTKEAAAAKVNYLRLRLYSYSGEADTMLLSWTGHKDYYAYAGISKTQILGALSADLRVRYSFKNFPGTGEIFYDGRKDDAPTAPGTYWLSFPSGYSGSTPGNYTVSIQYLNHAGTTLTLGSFTVHILDRSSDPLTKALFFDFNDDAASRKRYQYGGQYSGLNFDSSSRWQFIEYNSSTKTNDATPGFVDPLTGTLKLYTKAADTVRKNLSVRAYASGYQPLSYSPANAEIVQIRFKMENLKASAEGAANFRLCYHKDAGDTLLYETTYSLGENYVANGEYTTVTVPLTQTFRDCATITGIRPAFSYLIPADLSKPGSITIDYLYIGPKAGAPKEEDRSLFFDFDSSAEAQSRYAEAEQYNGIQFDRSSHPNWATEETSTLADLMNDCSINNEDGTLTVQVAEDHAYGSNNSYFGPWIMTTGVPDVRVSRSNRSYHALGYEPKVGDYIQLRFKLEGCVSATSTDPQVVVSYDKSIGGVSNRGAYDMVASYPLKNGVYQTVKIPVSEEFACADAITSLGFRFRHIKAETRGSGKVIIDYIYVGSEPKPPVSTFTVSFKDGNGKILATDIFRSGETVVYTGEAPTKAFDENSHYTFSGWDKDLSTITEDATVIALFTAEKHSFSYADEDGENHEGLCSCGYRKTGAHSWDKGVLTSPATCTEAGVMTYTCLICSGTRTESIAAAGHRDTSPKDNKCDICTARILPAALRFRTISLKGNIAVNYYMDLEESVVRDENAYMLFTLENGEQIKVSAKDGIRTLYQENYYYVFSCPMTAKEMADIIACQFFYAEGETEVYTYSIKTYADRILASNASESLRALLYAMLNYGAASQIHFDYHTDRLANEGLEVPDYRAISIEGFEINKDQGTALAKYAGASLLLTSETTLRIFFKVDASVEDFTASYNGQILPLGQRLGMYYADIPNISAKELDEYFTLVISDGPETAEISYAPMSYCASILLNVNGLYDRELQDCMAAMYLYNQAANVYFKD